MNKMSDRENEWYKWTKGQRIVIWDHGEIFSNIRLPEGLTSFKELQEYLEPRGFLGTDY